MKTLLIIILFVVAHAQTQAQILGADTVKYEYCELLGFEKFLSNKVTISVDFGQERKFWKDPRMKDEQTGKLKVFNSMVDGLNYMGENGWEFVQAYVVTIGQQNVYHWLLKKRKFTGSIAATK